MSANGQTDGATQDAMLAAAFSHLLQSTSGVRVGVESPGSNRHQQRQPSGEGQTRQRVLAAVRTAQDAYFLPGHSTSSPSELLHCSDFQPPGAHAYPIRDLGGAFGVQHGGAHWQLLTLSSVRTLPEGESARERALCEEGPALQVPRVPSYADGVGG